MAGHSLLAAGLAGAARGRGRGARELPGAGGPHLVRLHDLGEADRPAVQPEVAEAALQAGGSGRGRPHPLLDGTRLLLQQDAANKHSARALILTH